MALARADLESLLRHRNLDVTLSTAPGRGRAEDATLLPTGLPALDARLGGGIPRGQLSEVAGPASSGRSSVLAALMSAATRRGELAALIDPFDRFDPVTATDSGIDLRRLLWVRGESLPQARGGARIPDRPVDQGLKALNLVLQCGRFGLAALDMADITSLSARRIPFTTWLRLQRVIEGSRTACVLLVPEPMARSSAGLTILARRDETPGLWTGTADRARLFHGLRVDLRIVRSRFRGAEDGNVTITF